MDSFRDVKYDAFRRTDLRDDEQEKTPKIAIQDGGRLQPGFSFDKIARIPGGREGEIFDATVQYGDKEPVGGFVFKRLLNTAHLPAGPDRRIHLEKKLNSTLAVWDHIKQMKQHMKAEGREGFLIPGTIRGIVGETETGLLITDLRDGGKNDVLDLRNLYEHADVIRPEDWQQIKERVLADTELAIENRMRMNVGPPEDVQVDPWMVVRNRETGTFDVVVTDISPMNTVFSTTEKPEFVAEALEESREEIQKSLDVIEERLKEGWQSGGN